MSESFVHLIKECYDHFTNHGRLGADWTRSCIERGAIICEVDDWRACAVSPSHVKKIKERFLSNEMDNFTFPQFSSSINHYQKITSSQMLLLQYLPYLCGRDRASDRRAIDRARERQSETEQETEREIEQ
jgi:hypothetical protein